MSMPKNQLVDVIAKQQGSTATDAKWALDVVLEALKTVLAEGDVGVNLVGIGTLKPVVRAARTMRNPQTGKPVEVPEKLALRFKESAAMKRALNEDV